MSRCYVGGLPPDPAESALFDFFEPAGKILDVQIKRTISNDWFAFVHFEDAEGADEAVQSGHHVSVRVFGVPQTGSWQDLKDHFREAGDCVFADVYGDGTGIVEYSNYDDAHRAVQMFDNSNFRSHQGESGRIQLEISPPARVSSSYRSKPYESRGPEERERPPPKDYYDEDGRGGGAPHRYGPIRGSDRGGYDSRDRNYERRPSYGGRSRSPPRRPRYMSQRSPYRAAPHEAAPVPNDDRYPTQDSRSTEAYSTRASTGGGRIPVDAGDGPGGRRSPKKGPANGEGSWGSHAHRERR